jgi:hypothetical protein
MDARAAQVSHPDRPYPLLFPACTEVAVRFVGSERVHIEKIANNECRTLTFVLGPDRGVVNADTAGRSAYFTEGASPPSLSASCRFYLYSVSALQAH